MSEFPSREFVARVLGARVEEVRRVDHADAVDVAVVRLHDDSRAAVGPDGRFSFDSALVERAWTLVVQGLKAQASGESDSTPPERTDPSESTGEQVPDGNVETVLTWVGDDVDRARLALVAEGEREKPRAGLTAKLTELVNQPPADAGDAR